MSAEKKMFEEAKKLRELREIPLVLIIDDDEFSRVLAMIAIMKNVQGIAAENGQVGIDIYSRNAPDLVLLDIQMPVVSGMETLKRILDIDPDAKVIMLSARGTTANVESALDFGAKGFITKPFTADDLRKAASEQLEGFKSRSNEINH